jgi:hypothetical protein
MFIVQIGIFDEERILLLVLSRRSILASQQPVLKYQCFLPFYLCENRVLRRIFGPNGDEATGEWRRLHSEELNDLYSSPNIIRVIK